MAITVHLQPQQACSLAAYMSIIIGLARHIKGQAWCRYDQGFHQAAATNSSLEWHWRNADIWLTALADPPPTPNSTPTVSRTIPAASRPTPPGLPDDVCRRWNRAECSFSRCKFWHICLPCQAKHVVWDHSLITSGSAPHLPCRSHFGLRLWRNMHSYIASPL